MPVQVKIDGRHDIVMPDVASAVEYVADAFLKLDGDRERFRAMQAELAERHGALIAAGFPVTLAMHLRDLVRQDGRTVEIVTHLDSPAVGKSTVSSRYDLFGTADPAFFLMRALQSVHSMRHVASMISVPDETDDIDAKLRSKCARAVREARHGRDDREALALLRSYHDDFCDGAAFDAYEGTDATEILDAVPERVATRFRDVAAGLAPKEAHETASPSP